MCISTDASQNLNSSAHDQFWTVLRTSCSHITICWWSFTLNEKKNGAIVTFFFQRRRSPSLWRFSVDVVASDVVWSIRVQLKFANFIIQHFHMLAQTSWVSFQAFSFSIHFKVAWHCRSAGHCMMLFARHNKQPELTHFSWAWLQALVREENFSAPAACFLVRNHLVVPRQSPTHKEWEAWKTTHEARIGWHVARALQIYPFARAKYILKTWRSTTGKCRSQATTSATKQMVNFVEQWARARAAGILMFLIPVDCNSIIPRDSSW